ncbi:MAG: transcriptional repressor [Anaerolineae bacterium]|nr:MAG: transcriptional repressor [Anaerolineae bacterium]
MADSAAVQYLRSRGYRITPQRIAILGVLEGAQGHLTPAEVLSQARTALPGLTEPTVYRTLDFLVSEGVILRTFSSGDVVYELAAPHHHLVCRSCGAMMEIAPEAFQGLYERLQAETGYLVDEAHLTLSGYCPQCQ